MSNNGSGMNVAVLGMGRMGRAIAGRLLEGGHRLCVWNRSPGKASDLVAAGAREATSVAEAVAVGRAGGLSDSELRDLLKNSPMLPPGLQNRFEGILTGQQEAWWSTVLGAKDAGLALDVARGTHVARPIAEVVHQLYDRAATTGDDAADIAAVARLYGVPHSAPSGTHR